MKKPALQPSRAALTAGPRRTRARRRARLAAACTAPSNPRSNLKTAPGAWSRANQRVGAWLQRHERLAWAALALALAVVAGWPAWVHKRAADPDLRADRRGAARIDRQGAACLGRRQGLRGGDRLGGARGRRARAPDRRRPQGGRRAQERGHRRGHHRQRHHPDQPARGARRSAHQGDLLQRHGVGCHADQRAARERPRGACRPPRAPTSSRPPPCAPPAACARATR